MRRCPKCNKTYDDTWKICIIDNSRLVDYSFSDKPITFRKLESGNILSSYGEAHDNEPIFYPKDNFYSNWTDDNKKLSSMASEIAVWLSIDTNNVLVGYDPRIKTPAAYMFRDGKDMIVVNSYMSDKPFKVGAVLAHEMMHLFMNREGIRYADTIHNEKETDLMTIKKGLGILVINGMHYENYAWLSILVLLGGGLVWEEYKEWYGYFKPKEYAFAFIDDLKGRNLWKNDVIGLIHLNARHYLPYFSSKGAVKNKLEIIQKLEQKRIWRNVAFSILTLIILMGIILNFLFSA